MMDYDERVSFHGEMVPLYQLTNGEISDIIADLQEQKPINSVHAAYLKDMLAHLDDELVERIGVDYRKDEYFYYDENGKASR